MPCYDPHVGSLVSTGSSGCLAAAFFMVQVSLSSLRWPAGIAFASTWVLVMVCGSQSFQSFQPAQLFPASVFGKSGVDPCADLQIDEALGRGKPFVCFFLLFILDLCVLYFVFVAVLSFLFYNY